MKRYLWLFPVIIITTILTTTIFNQTHNQHERESVLLLQTNSYHIGEDITLTIKNPFNKTIYLLGHCGMIQVERLINGSWKSLATGEDRGINELGKQIFCEKEDIVWATLRPGEIIRVNLMPMYGELMSVDEGTYRVKVTYGVECNLSVKEYTHKYILISDELGKIINKTEVFPVAVKCENKITEESPVFYIIGTNPFLEGPVSNITGIVEYKLSKEGIL